jgi:hypothetical protein
MLQKGNSGKADWDLSVPLCAPSRPGTLSDCTLKKYCLPTDVLVLSIIIGNFIWHLYSYLMLMKSWTS